MRDFRPCHDCVLYVRRRNPDLKRSIATCDAINYTVARNETRVFTPDSRKSLPHAVRNSSSRESGDMPSICTNDDASTNVA